MQLYLMFMGVSGCLLATAIKSVLSFSFAELLLRLFVIVKKSTLRVEEIHYHRGLKRDVVEWSCFTTLYLFLQCQTSMVSI